MEHPTQFFAVSTKKALNHFVEAKKQEARSIEKTAKTLAAQLNTFETDYEEEELNENSLLLKVITAFSLKN